MQMHSKNLYRLLAMLLVGLGPQGLRMRTVKALYDTAVKAKSLKDLIRLMPSLKGLRPVRHHP
jgi:hypothetical protein